MYSIGVAPGDIERLKKSMEGIATNLPKEIAKAINETAKKTRTTLNRGAREELATKAKAINAVMKLPKKANKNKLRTTVIVDKTGQIPLRDYGARQTRAGVSYKISKTQGRKTVPHAFQGPRPGVHKWGGRVFIREGQARTPIQQMWGPSPWGVVVKRKIDAKAAAEAGPMLKKEIEERIRVNVLKRSGVITNAFA